MLLAVRATVLVGGLALRIPRTPALAPFAGRARRYGGAGIVGWHPAPRFGPNFSTVAPGDAHAHGQSVSRAASAGLLQALWLSPIAYLPFPAGGSALISGRAKARVTRGSWHAVAAASRLCRRPCTGTSRKFQARLALYSVTPSWLMGPQATYRAAVTALAGTRDALLVAAGLLVGRASSKGVVGQAANSAYASAAALATLSKTALALQRRGSCGRPGKCRAGDVFPPTGNGKRLNIWKM